MEQQKIKLSFDLILVRIKNSNLKFNDWLSYYLILKEGIYSGIFGMEYLHNFAYSLLIAKVKNMSKRDFLKFEKCRRELANFIDFTYNSETKEKFEGCIIKKRFRK